MGFLATAKHVLTRQVDVSGRLIRVTGWVIVVAAIVGGGVVGHLEMKLVQYAITETGRAGDPSTLPAPVARKLASFAAETGDFQRFVSGVGAFGLLLLALNGYSARRKKAGAPPSAATPA